MLTVTKIKSVNSNVVMLSVITLNVVVPIYAIYILHNAKSDI